VRAWESSGLSRKAFCDERKLNYHTFCYWRKRIKDDEGNEGFAVACYQVPITDTRSDGRDALTFETEGISFALGQDALVTVRGRLTIGQLETLLVASGAGREDVSHVHA
jgi:hypothetical protein